VLDDLLPPGNKMTGRLDLDVKLNENGGAWILDSKAAGRNVAMTFSRTARGST
jgi:hypothetical protein